VDAWEQQLAADRPDALPPESTLLHCDRLSINEDPAYVRPASNPNEPGGRQMGPMQVRAERNVRIDGRSEQGTFGARGDFASYDHVKQLFLLKGNPLAPAQVWLPSHSSGSLSPLSAQVITYNPSTGIKVNGASFQEFTPSARQDPLVPGPVRQ
jgi:hypothetical protein